MQDNFFEKMIKFVAPRAALNRSKARYYLEESTRLIEEQKRYYEAAAKGRRTEGWVVTGNSINAENQGVLAILRQRSRDLVQNNYWAAKAIEVITNHTVGIGIMPNFKTTSDAQRKRMAAVFSKWQRKKYCDFNGRRNFAGIQKLVMRTVATSGECIIRLRRTDLGPGLPPIQLQVQEPDVIDTMQDGINLPGGGFIIQGVEFDANGRRVAYHLFDEHPGEALTTLNNFRSRRIPASDVIHVFEEVRPGQVRGIPFGVSAFIRIKDHGDYEDAQIMRQKIAACFTAFVTSAEKAAAFGMGNPNAKANIERAERMVPGMIEILKPGETISFGQPPGVPEYSSFSKFVLLGIANAYFLTYEALTGDLSGSNFSSSRMGWLEMARKVSNWQYQLMVPDFCEEVFEWYNSGCIIAGLIKPGMDCQWTAPRREMFDPQKEIQAIVEAIKNGLITRSEALRELGYDPKEFMEEIAAEWAIMDEMGLTFPSDPRQAIKGGSGGQEPPPDETQTETKPAKTEEKKPAGE